MTAAHRALDSAVVTVALDDRGYDIVIGRGVLGSLGARIKSLRPGAKLFDWPDRFLGSTLRCS